MPSGLSVSVSVKQTAPAEWEAEVKPFGLSATGETIEDAIAEITPKIEQYLKDTFATKRTVSAELESVTAKAEFTINVISDKTLDDFKGDDEEGSEKSEDPK